MEPTTELFNWVIGVSIGNARLTLWIGGLATAPEVRAKAQADACAFSGRMDVVVDAEPLNMGAD